MPSRLIDETGNQYGRLIVLKRSEERRKGCILWECRCSCGRIKNISGGKLRSGDVKSCGCLRQERRLPKGESSFRHLFRDYKRKAKRKGLSWKLTIEQFKQLTSSSCYYCGVHPEQVVTYRGLYGRYVYNGIDRVDNKQGYIPENVVPCCGICNSFKETYTEKEFLAHVVKIVEYLKLKEK